MGYRGKVAQQEQARLLRADGMILQDIAQHLRSPEDLFKRQAIGGGVPAPPRSELRR